MSISLVARSTCAWEQSAIVGGSGMFILLSGADAEACTTSRRLEKRLNDSIVSV